MAAKKLTVFTEQENALLRSTLSKWVDTLGSQSKVSARIGVGQATISAFLSGRQGASYPFGEAISSLEKKGVRDFLGWTAATKPEASYPNRDKVIAACQDLGFFPETFARLADVELRAGAADPDTLWWMRRVVSIEEELRAIR